MGQPVDQIRRAAGGSVKDYPALEAQIRRARTATRGKLAHLATLRRMRLESMKREIKRRLAQAAQPSP